MILGNRYVGRMRASVSGRISGGSRQRVGKVGLKDGRADAEPFDNMNCKEHFAS